MEKNRKNRKKKRKRKSKKRKRRAKKRKRPLCNFKLVSNIREIVSSRKRVHLYLSLRAVFGIE
jgi:hypothetical protein